jgi:hypothetical protein
VTPAWLADPTDERVKTALGRRCGVCRAAPGVACRHPWETSEPLNRVVHLERAQQHFDTKKDG